MNTDILGDVYNIAWSGHDSKWLLAGTAAGLVGWKVNISFTKMGKKYCQVWKKPGLKKEAT